MKTRIGLTAAALATAVSLSACGGGGTGAYCDDLDAAKTQIEDLQSGDPGQLGPALESIKQLADEAPDEVSEDWAVLDENVTKLEQVFADAGLDLDDLEGLQSGEIPEGLDVEKLQGIGTELQDLNGQEMQDAQQAIREHAKDECDIDFNV